MSTIDKMHDSNSKVRRWLTERGIKDIHFFPHTRFSKDVHLGELSFDGICRDDFYIILFQVKSNCKPSREIQKKMYELSLQYKGIVKFIWIDCPDRKDVVVYGL